MEALKNIWQGLDWSVPLNMLISVIPALFCITLHELSHGYVAYSLGDDTAKSRGRLTLNPLKHIDIMGLLMMVAFKFGWAKPVPVNMYKFKNPKRGMAITALAGPVSNVLISCVFLFIYGLIFYPLANSDSPAAWMCLETVYTISYLSLALAVFNILPIPPLDGSKVLFAVLSESVYYKLMRYEKYGMILLLVVVGSGVLGAPLARVTSFIYDKLFIIAEISFEIITSVAG